MKRTLRGLCLVLVLCLCLSLAAPAGAAAVSLKGAVNGAARWILNAVPDPGAGDYFWAVFSLSRSGYKAEDSWYRSYLSAMDRELSENDGKLKTRRYSDYAKAVIAYTALGQQPPEELIRPLSNY